jgi:hypothetical protein
MITFGEQTVANTVSDVAHTLHFMQDTPRRGIQNTQTSRLDLRIVTEHWLHK